MDKKEYLQRIVSYFSSCGSDDLGDDIRLQVKRCLLDYLGCAVFSASQDCCPRLTDLLTEMGAGTGTASVWGRGVKLSPMLAGAANAARISSIELDDCSGIGASVHPGVYVMSSVLAVWEAYGAREEDVIRAIVFGYDICMRMGLLATEQVRKLGLHGPGLIGGMASAAAAGVLRGLDERQLFHAISIAAVLAPLCPFRSFIEGAGVKDLYGGWGVYLGVMAAEAAKKGLTGPNQVLEGEKSLDFLFAGERGLEIEPGEHFYICDISYKQFSACHSVHPAMTAVQRLLARTHLDPGRISRVIVQTYPYSYALDQGVTWPLNSSSARLSLRYTAAVCLLEGRLSPLAFLPEALKRPEYQQLAFKVHVEKNPAYGDGPFGIRGTRLLVEMQDGTRYEEETLGTNWDQGPTREQLEEKFTELCEGALTEENRSRLERFAWDEGRRDIGQLAAVMGKIQGNAGKRKDS